MRGYRFWRSREFGALIVLAAMLVACEIASWINTGSSFAPNLPRVCRDFSFIAIAAIGSCIVIVTGGIDLSSGSVMNLSAIVLAFLYVESGAPAFVALAVAVMAGTAAGFVNGALVGKLNLPPFIATLGMLSIARGVGYAITGGPTIPIDWEDRNEKYFGFELLGNQSVALMVFLSAIAAVVMARFRWGRYVYAIGGNEEAARFAGVGIGAVKMGAYTAAGFLSAIAGCALALGYGSSAVGGVVYTLQVIAACAVGGANFAGGEGTVLGAVIGAAILQVLPKLLIHFNISDKNIEMVYGATIILAVAIDQVRLRLGGRKTS